MWDCIHGRWHFSGFCFINLYGFLRAALYRIDVRRLGGWGGRIGLMMRANAGLFRNEHADLLSRLEPLSSSSLRPERVYRWILSAPEPGKNLMRLMSARIRALQCLRPSNNVRR